MLFSSFEFIFLFLPVALAVARPLKGTALLGWICVVSLVFYGLTGHAWFLIPMAVTTVLDFWIGRRLDLETSASRRRLLLLISLCGNLGLLAYFKYAGLFLDTTESLVRLTGYELRSRLLEKMFSVVLPAGISFYTFQTLSYVLDIYRRKDHAEPSFLKYLAFVAFFPHLVAGPLTRHDQLIPQLSRLERDGISPRWKAGILLFSVGLIKKILIADRVAAQIDPLIQGIGAQGFAASWLALLGYSLQIYFDFSGYSDMAIGLGRLFGIELPINFDSPYQALNPSDFWRRWHITLSLWLRDYLYIPLGGNRGTPARVKRNLMITMVLGGLWHGAHWTFAVWGFYHGALLILYHAGAKTWERLHVAAQRAATYLLVCVGWVFFRAPTLSDAAAWLGGLCGRHGIEPSTAALLRPAVLVAVALTIAMAFRNAARRNLEELPAYAAGALGFGSAVAVVFLNLTSKFLYFQF